MPFRAFHITPDGTLRQDIDAAEIRRIFQSRQGLLWVDISETTEDDGYFLREAFKFHALAVEDCVSTLIHPPKVDDFGDHLFIVVHGINHAVESTVVETAELGVFLGPHYVVTNHNFPMYGVEAIIQRARVDGRPMRNGPDFLAHAIIDAVIDNILPTIDRMEEVAETLEEMVVRDPHATVLETLLKLKRSAVHVNRVMVPQREVMNQLSRGDFGLIRPEARVYYRDVYDHMYRVAELNQGLRERASDILATYLSAVANRQNETMRTLAVVATIFMPLTLLAGIYGMNFEHMPELSWPWAYFAVLGVMATTIVGLLSYFWLRRWLSWSRHQALRARGIFAVDPTRVLGHVSNITRTLRL